MSDHISTSGLNRFLINKFQGDKSTFPAFEMEIREVLLGENQDAFDFLFPVIAWTLDPATKKPTNLDSMYIKVIVQPKLVRGTAGVTNSEIKTRLDEIANEEAHNFRQKKIMSLVRVTISQRLFKRSQMTS